MAVFLIGTKLTALVFVFGSLMKDLIPPVNHYTKPLGAVVVPQWSLVSFFFFISVDVLMM